jgi:hypothetical protein
MDSDVSTISPVPTQVFLYQTHYTSIHRDWGTLMKSSKVCEGDKVGQNK